MAFYVSGPPYDGGYDMNNMAWSSWPEQAQQSAAQSLVLQQQGMEALAQHQQREQMLEQQQQQQRQQVMDLRHQDLAFMQLPQQKQMREHLEKAASSQPGPSEPAAAPAAQSEKSMASGPSTERPSNVSRSDNKRPRNVLAVGGKTGKRVARPSQWMKNIRKEKRTKGEAYVNCKGKYVAARKPKHVACDCKFECTSKISEEEQKHIFKAYWALESYVRQKEFLCNLIEESSPKKIITNRKETTRRYILNVCGQKHRVCKTFFLSTLDVGKSTVDTALKYKDKVTQTFIGVDGRGKHTPHNKTSPEQLESVRSHIESFPVVSSHYKSRKQGKQYLDADLNVRKMYRLYMERMEAENKTGVSEKMYRKIFDTEYNLSFRTKKGPPHVQFMTAPKK